MKFELRHNGKSLVPDGLLEGEYTLALTPDAHTITICGPSFQGNPRITEDIETIRNETIIGEQSAARGHVRLNIGEQSAARGHVRLNIGERSAILVNENQPNTTYFDGGEFKFQTVYKPGQYKLRLDQFECDLVITQEFIYN